MQAIGRAGLVKNPSDRHPTILHTIYPVSRTEIKQITGIDVDWTAADNNLDTLREVVAQREAREAAEAEAIASGDVQAVAEMKECIGNATHAD